jgi:putative ABC transport system ATP-binding protein
VHGRDGATVTALDHVDLELHAGEMRAITGPSGSGKSTLLHILGLIDRPSAGTHTFMGRETTSMDERERGRVRAESISFMFQDNWLLPWLDAVDNVLAPQLHVGARPAPALRRKAEDLLGRLGLGDRRRARAGELSGGQRQRVCLARALLKSPRLVLADEPSASLDSRTAANLLELLRTVQAEEGCAVLMATHDPALIGPMGRDIVHLHDGRTVPA